MSESSYKFLFNIFCELLTDLFSNCQTSAAIIVQGKNSFLYQIASYGIIELKLPDDAVTMQ